MPLSVRALSLSRVIFLVIPFIVYVEYGMIVPAGLYGGYKMLITWQTALTALIFSVLIVVHYFLSKRYGCEMIKISKDECR